jgi:hypothetical protein
VFECFSDNVSVIIGYETFEDYFQSMTNVFSLLNFCNENTVKTPFDGSYSRTSEVRNNKPVYQHAFGYQAIWTGMNWQFIDPSLKIGTMNGQDSSVQIYPQDQHDWELVREQNSPINYKNLSITCRKSNFLYFCFFLFNYLPEKKNISSVTLFF